MTQSIVAQIAEMIACARKQTGPVVTIRVGLLGANSKFINGYQFEHMSLVSKLRACLQKTCVERSNWTSEPDVLLMRSDYADRVRSTTTVLQNTKAPIVAKQNRLRHFSISTNRQYDLLVTLTQESVITADQNQDLFRLISNKEPQAVRFIQKGVYLEKVIHTGYVVTLKYEISKISPKGVTKIASTGQACSYECAVSFVCIQDTNQQNTQNNSESNSIIAQILLSRAVSLLGSYRSSNGTLVKLDEIKLEFVR